MPSIELPVSTNFPSLGAQAFVRETIIGLRTGSISDTRWRALPSKRLRVDLVILYCPCRVREHPWQSS